MYLPSRKAGEEALWNNTIDVCFSVVHMDLGTRVRSKAPIMSDMHACVEASSWELVYKARSSDRAVDIILCYTWYILKCPCCCSHINSNNQVRGHRTCSSHSGAEEYPREKTQTTQGGTRIPGISHLMQFMLPPETYKSDIGSQSTMLRRPV